MKSQPSLNGRSGIQAVYTGILALIGLLALISMPAALHRNLLSVEALRILFNSPGEIPMIALDEHPRRDFLLALDQSRKKDCDGALATILSAPESAMKHGIAAEIALDCGRAQLAADEWKKLGAWQRLMDAGEAAQSDKKSEDAYIYWSTAFQLLPEESAGRLGYSLVYGKNEVEEAINLLDKMFSDYPNSLHKGEWYQQMGEYLALQNKYEESLQAYQEAVKIEPFNVWGWVGLGGVFLRSGDLDAAEQTAYRAYEISSNNFGVFNLMGDIRYEQKRWAEAVLEYRKAAKLQPMALLFIKEANSLRNNADYSNALKLYEEILDQYWNDLDPHWRALLYINQAECFVQMGEIDLARDRIESALLIAPDDKDILLMVEKLTP